MQPRSQRPDRARRLRGNPTEVIELLIAAEATSDVAPLILDEFANTASAGSIIAFHLHREGLAKGDVGVICSFGAGYSVGSLVLRKR